jgi:RecJ-like exonuclease
MKIFRVTSPLLKLLVIGVICMLSSCRTITEELLVPMVEYDMNKGLNNVKSGKMVSDKKDIKERERLLQEGKCPDCRGMGKTPDGLYSCAKCNGTGKSAQ